MLMPYTCPHCGKIHRTQEELNRRGNEVSSPPDAEPLPRDIAAGEAPEEISKEYAPKRKKSKKS